jgi:hypothetical protein
MSAPAHAPVVLRPQVVAPPPPKPAPAKPDFGITTVEIGHWSSDGRYWVFDKPKAEAKDWETGWKR